MKLSFLIKAAAFTAIGGAVLLNAKDAHEGHDHAGHDHSAHAKKAEMKKAMPAEMKKADMAVDLKKASTTVFTNYGHSVGSQLTRDKEIVDLEAFIKGVRAGFAGEENSIKEEDVKMAMKVLEPILKKKQDF